MASDNKAPRTGRGLPQNSPSGEHSKHGANADREQPKYLLQDTLGRDVARDRPEANGAHNFVHVAKPRKEIKATYEYAYEEAPGIAFMITQVMKAELDELGYTPEQIDELTPAETRRILRGKRKDAN
jgi:hypothetical protein